MAVGFFPYMPIQRNHELLNIPYTHTYYIRRMGQVKKVQLYSHDETGMGIDVYATDVHDVYAVCSLCECRQYSETPKFMQSLLGKVVLCGITRETKIRRDS